MGLINKERYVKVTDLRLGQEGSYTDFEELAMSDLPTWLDELNGGIDGITEHSGNYRISPPSGAPDHKRAVYTTDQPLQQDIRDILFYNAVHVLSSWEECEGPGTVTSSMILLVIDSSRHLLEDVLTCEHVMRQSA